MSWNPQQYLKFSAPRLRPAVDLIGRIEASAPATIYDLGCGAGNVTALLAARWPQARLVGIDSSEAMLRQAARALPQVTWLAQDLGRWRADAPADLIFSNAALHWVAPHAQVLPALLDSLHPGGILAVQMPRNFAAPSHTAIAATVREGPWRARLEPLLQEPPVADPTVYYDMLAPLARHLDIWETEYLQVLSGADPVLEWTRGSWLPQFLEPLPEAQRPAFEADYAQRLLRAYPRRSDGSTLFPFRRLFLVLHKP
jgi:trans-aconitate 2-methyltransferase